MQWGVYENFLNGGPIQEHETDTSDLIRFVHDGLSMHVVAVQRSKETGSILKWLMLVDRVKDKAG